jgi:hypothetical protein
MQVVEKKLDIYFLYKIINRCFPNGNNSATGIGPQSVLGGNVTQLYQFKAGTLANNLGLKWSASESPPPVASHRHAAEADMHMHARARGAQREGS